MAAPPRGFPEDHPVKLFRIARKNTPCIVKQTPG
jgi:hypothetical protein